MDLPMPLRHLPMPLRQPTDDLYHEIVNEPDNIGVLGPYLRGFIENETEKKGKIFQMIVALFTWLSKKTNIDIPGFKELLNGAHIVIDDDKGELFEYMYQQLNRVSSDNSSLKDKSVNTTKVSSHHSKLSKKNMKTCESCGEEDQMRLGEEDQMRLGHGTIYNCNDKGDLILDETNNMFDLLIGVRNIQSDNKTNGSTWIQLEYARIYDETGKTSVRYLLHHSKSWIKYKYSGENQGPFGSSFYTEKGLPYILRIGKDKEPSSILNDEKKQHHIEEYESKPPPSMFGRWGGKRKKQKKNKKIKKTKKIKNNTKIKKIKNNTKIKNKKTKKIKHTKHKSNRRKSRKKR